MLANPIRFDGAAGDAATHARTDPPDLGADTDAALRRGRLHRGRDRIAAGRPGRRMSIGGDMTIDFDLEGKRALVTGAGQGVGQAIAPTLAAAGAEVLVNDYFPDRAEAAAARSVPPAARRSPLPFDVTDHPACATPSTGAGGVDILVNNAGNAGTEGFGTPTPFVDTDPDEWASYLGVNLHGVMSCIHAALPAMIERGWGRIITIVSDAARSGGAQMAAYSAAKAGAAGFSRAIASEVGRYGITANNIALGTMRTPATDGVLGRSRHGRSAEGAHGGLPHPPARRSRRRRLDGRHPRQPPGLLGHRPDHPGQRGLLVRALIGSEPSGA